MRLRIGAAALLLLATACGQAVTPSSYTFPAQPLTACHAPAGGHLVAARGVVVRRDVGFPTPYGEQRFDVYSPRNGRSDRPGVLVVHGGGWNTGDKANMRVVSSALARAGFVAFAVGYTLAGPHHPGAPAQLDELRAAVRDIRAHADRYGVDGTRVGALGSSAGAHLVMLLATGTGACDAGDRLGAAVGWSGPYDLPALQRLADAGCSDGCRQVVPKMLAYTGCPLTTCARTWDEASPVRDVDADDPPTLLFASTREFVPPSQAREMADALAAAGVPHDLVVLPGTRHAQAYRNDALPTSISFLAQELAPGSAVGHRG